MNESVLWLAAFLVLALAGLAGLFLYGWRRRQERMPDVPPLPPEDEAEWKR